MDILGPRSQTLGTWLAVFLAAGWALYELRKDDQLPTGATVSSKLLPILLIATLCITAAMHLIAAVINRRQPEAQMDKPQGVDPAKHEEIASKLARRAHEVGYLKGEVEREQLLRKEQVEIRDREINERGGRIGNLEQELRVSQNTIDSLRDQLSAPNGRFKLKRVRYIATESRSLELRDVGKLPEKDLTEFFEDKYLENGKLVIPPGLYRKLFGPLNDPSLGMPKVLEIRFVHAGNEMSVLLPENISITLPFPYAVTPEHMT